MAKWEGGTVDCLEFFGDSLFRMLVTDPPRHLISEIVTGGAVDWPILRQLFLAGQDFSDDQINRAPILWQWNAQSLGAAQLQLLKIFQGPIQAVGVIDAQAGDSATGD